MHSRSLLLLKRDYEVVNSELYEGISAQLSTDNYFKWRVVFPALDGTIWTGGEYRVLVDFPRNYNTFPPEIRFLTIPYHPNINPTSGLVNLALLHPTNWTESNSIIDIILSLQQLLSDPYLEHGCVLNLEAANCYTNTPSTYRQIAQDCVVASIKISAGIEPYNHEESPTPTPVLPQITPIIKEPRQPNLAPTQIQHVSYSDYLSIWSDLATTKPIKNRGNIQTHSSLVKHPETDEKPAKTTEIMKELSPKGIANISVDKRIK
ncbi:Ubiquitin-conjugating enzyme E2 S-like [Oopsacas minuta]|uniref:Ubiquitin-conjugating enzyme E2 S-like n=1 Tax=Oopsacas minuta TaxID=111878 RepID=A0AAV7JRQ3_9METZ|nr:Ubiquitin-conjugating enzyme E2 S-like [Oopsacas minuta]